MRGIDLTRDGDDAGEAVRRNRNVEKADEYRQSAAVLRRHQLKKAVMPSEGKAEKGHAGENHPPQQREIITSRKWIAEEPNGHRAGVHRSCGWPASIWRYSAGAMKGPRQT